MGIFEANEFKRSMKRLGDDDSEVSEVSGTDYLAKTVLVSRKIGPIGFIRFKPQAKPKPATPKKPGKKR